MSKVMQIIDIEPDWAAAKASVKMLETNFNNGIKFIYDSRGSEAYKFVTDEQLLNIKQGQDYVNNKLKQYETLRVGTGSADNLANVCAAYSISQNFVTLQSGYVSLNYSDIEPFVDINSPTLKMELLTNIINNEQNFVARREEIHSVLDLIRMAIFETYGSVNNLYSQTATTTTYTPDVQSINFINPTTVIIKKSSINLRSDSIRNGSIYHYEDMTEQVENTTQRDDSIYCRTILFLTFIKSVTTAPYITSITEISGTMTAAMYYIQNVGDYVSLTLNLTAETYPKTVTAGNLETYLNKNKYELTLDYVLSFEL